MIWTRLCKILAHWEIKFYESDEALQLKLENRLEAVYATQVYWMDDDHNLRASCQGSRGKTHYQTIGRDGWNCTCIGYETNPPDPITEEKNPCKHLCAQACEATYNF